MLQQSDKRDTNRRDMRIQVVLKDQINMNTAATVDLSDGGLLISSGIQLDPGTKVTIFPLLDEMDPKLFQVEGEVVRAFEDILQSPFSDDRFLMGIRLDVDAHQRLALRKILDAQLN